MVTKPDLLGALWTEEAGPHQLVDDGVPGHEQRAMVDLLLTRDRSAEELERIRMSARLGKAYWNKTLARVIGDIRVVAECGNDGYVSLLTREALYCGAVETQWAELVTKICGNATDV
jgi:hypothetical protein